MLIIFWTINFTSPSREKSYEDPTFTCFCRPISEELPARFIMTAKFKENFYLADITIHITAQILIPL